MDLISWLAYALNRLLGRYRNASKSTSCLVKIVLLYAAVNLCLCLCSIPFVILGRIFPSTPTPTVSMEEADRRHTLTPQPTRTPLPTRTHAPEPTKEPSPTPVPTPALGQRGLPMPLGETFVWCGDGREVELTIQRTMMGDEALTMVLEANSFNDVPGEGFVYALVYARARYLTGDESEPWDMDEFDFVVVSKNRLLKAPSVVDPEPNFEWKGFPGTEAEGWMTFVVYADDPAPALVFTPDRGTDVSEGVWFALK
ncbi:MAG: hypothetical protein ABIK79_14000 [Chloroflexota bacterium]|nr:hypothetical protein [Anaerolineae bacterium]